MSDETVNRYEERIEHLECMNTDLFDARESLKQMIEQIRAALGIGPGTDVVRAAERARADRERLDWLERTGSDTESNPWCGSSVVCWQYDGGSCREVGEYREKKLRDAIDVAIDAEGEKA